MNFEFLHDYCFHFLIALKVIFFPNVLQNILWTSLFGYWGWCHL
jgi:hypothetical protein